MCLERVSKREGEKEGAGKKEGLGLGLKFIFFIVLRARECGSAVLWRIFWFCGVVLVVLCSTTTETVRNSRSIARVRGVRARVF